MPAPPRVAAAPPQIHALAELGSAAAEAAHEINNHLHVISGYAQLISAHRDLGLWHKIEHDLSTLNAAIERCVQLTDGISRFIPQLATPPSASLGSTLAAVADFAAQLNSFDCVEIALDGSAEADTQQPSLAPFQLRQVLFCALRFLAGSSPKTGQRCQRIVVNSEGDAEEARLIFSAQALSTDTTSTVESTHLGSTVPSAMNLETFLHLCQALGITVEHAAAEKELDNGASHALTLHLPLAAHATTQPHKPY
jgi:hypothetical protein